jgi:hypothetical protein
MDQKKQIHKPLGRLLHQKKKNKKSRGKNYWGPGINELKKNERIITKNKLLREPFKTTKQRRKKLEKLTPKKLETKQKKL